MEINVDTVLRTNPFLALDIPNIEEIALKYLPYSVGIEVECDTASTYDIEYFKSIPNIVEVLSGYGEERFRIPKGIEGLCCLYNISEQLTQHNLLTDSGIHYHIDFSDSMEDGNCYYDFILYNKQFILENQIFLLEELDKWEYKGTYNSRGFNTCYLDNTDIIRGNWIRFQSGFQTLEFRIGEMTFDYEVLSRRILHLSLLCNLLKDKMDIWDSGVYVNELANQEKIENTLKNRIINIWDKKEELLIENVEL